jgi:urease accessory protein
MTIVESICREPGLPAEAHAYARDSITLGWESRVQVHGRRQTDGGVEFGLSLPRGTVLRAGDCLVLDAERLVVTVSEQPEEMFVVEPRTPHQWALWAYHIGNRHQPVMITGTALVCPDLPGVEDLLRQQHIPYARATLSFTPATAVGGHHH